MDARACHLLFSTVDVVLWAIVQRHEITNADIMRRWGVHRATANRWRHALNSARERAQLMEIPRAAPTRAPIRMVEARAL